MTRHIVRSITTGRRNDRLKKIFGIGTVVVDHVVQLPSFPERDTKTTVERHWRQIGGPVPVALSTASFYGAETVFLGRWGDDEAGRFIAEGLAARGLDVGPCRSDVDWSTGFAHVWIDSATGTRTIAYSRGEFPPADEHDVEPRTISGCGILHLDGSSPVASLRAARLMKEQGGLVVLDAGSWKLGMDDLMPLVDLLIASELFRRSRFEDEDVVPERVLELGSRSVIATSGAQGASYFDGQQTLHQPALPIDAIDSNGAGDIFSGAILYSMANGWPIDMGLRFATAVAGWACTQKGNSTLPDSSDVERILREISG